MWASLVDVRSLLTTTLLVVASGCLTPTDNSPVWQHDDISDNILTLRAVTETAPKRAISMVAGELEESLKNHSKASTGEAARILESLATQVQQFKLAIPSESKKQLLDRIDTMEQSLPTSHNPES